MFRVPQKTRVYMPKIFCFFAGVWAVMVLHLRNRTFGLENTSAKIPTYPKNCGTTEQNLDLAIRIPSHHGFLCCKSNTYRKPLEKNKLKKPPVFVAKVKRTRLEQGCFAEQTVHDINCCLKSITYKGGCRRLVDQDMSSKTGFLGL